VCSRRTGRCECSQGFYGPDCGQYCNATETCGGHGRCDEGGMCVCESRFQGAANCTACSAGFFGDECDVECRAQTTCSGRGSCASDGTCACLPQFQGEQCAECSAHRFGRECETTCVGNTTGSGAAVPIGIGAVQLIGADAVSCGSHGQCNNVGECACDEGYHGASCGIHCSSD
jgi:hypothetical protein